MAELKGTKKSRFLWVFVVFITFCNFVSDNSSAVGTFSLESKLIIQKHFGHKFLKMEYCQCESSLHSIMQTILAALDPKNYSKM